MLQKMRQRSTYDDFTPLLTLRRSAQVLGSSEKQWEAKLRTLPLIINENTPKCAETKKCAVSIQKTGILFGEGASIEEISHIARILAPFEMTGTVGQFY
jgi:hypothetical protein